MRLAGAIPPVTDAAISLLQNSNGVRLPAEYIALLKVHNGGHLEGCGLEHGGVRLELDLLLSVGDPTAETQEWEVDVVVTRLGVLLADDPGRVGTLLLPIISVGWDDYVCLDFRRNRFEPTVVLFDLAGSKEWAPKVTELAPTFPEFIARIDG